MERTHEKAFFTAFTQAMFSAKQQKIFFFKKNMGIYSIQRISTSFRHFIHEFWMPECLASDQNLCSILKKIARILCPRINPALHQALSFCVVECRTFRPRTFRPRTFRLGHFGHGRLGHRKCQRRTFRPEP